ncbi:endolytic transglycosylase MltG [Sanguibacter antarcticus]|uniref:Endolytic murein transglycosylase n=1 Tax=Sanguibacter antarcticus TaxID=372484 RepID=A0A2A9E400_9MICO|nr:endolytic transglycosylase MltG [Sanguibacter antarcticus]PFG33085.1 UPF0755 protein [Sanguibacter antarcticus]
MNDLFEGPSVSDARQAEGGLSRAEKRALREERKRAAKRRRRALIAVLVAIVIIGLGGYFVWTRGVEFFSGLDEIGGTEEEILDFTGPGTGQVQVTVEAGATGTQMGTALTEAGVVASRAGFVAAYTANESSASIQPGTYNLFKEMKSSDAVVALLDPANRADYIFDVLPGSTADVITAKIAKVTGVTEADVDAAIADTAALGLPAEANGALEGWLWGDRYEFGLDVTPAEMVTEMIRRTVAQLDELAVPAENRETVLTKASIVEREAGADDKPNVASVIENRLALPMKLQMDSTVHYLVGGTDDATTTAADRETDSPYNTYLYAGLPPTPISSPGIDSINAVLNPPVTDYIYFVTVNPLTHETRFAATWTEHRKNVELYQDWLAENGS